MRNWCLLFFVVMCIASCDDSNLLKTMEEIKQQADADPMCALNRADSLKPFISRADEYTQMKFILLKMRLSAKLHIKPKPDTMAEELVDYFDENGKGSDLQEACYYAGNVYLQLNDVPRCLMYLTKSVNSASKNGCRDSVMLAETRSILEGMSKEKNVCYRYFKDFETSRLLKEENDNYHLTLMFDSLVGVCMTFVFVIVMLYKRNKHLQEVVFMKENIATLEQERSMLKSQTEKLEEDCGRERRLLIETKRKLSIVENNLCSIESELENKEKLLEAKLEENKRFSSLLHKAELKEKAEDVVIAIRHASEGRHRMSEQEWQEFYRAIDELQPNLMQRMISNLGRFTEQQQKVCYLLSIGLTNSQIENLTDIPHATVWRWTKKFNWV